MVRRTRAPARALIFDERCSPAWVVAYDPWRRVIESRQLPAGTDLVRAFVTELLRYLDDGWQLSEFSSFSASFHTVKLHETKRQVCITTDDPALVRDLNKVTWSTP